MIKIKVCIFIVLISTSSFIGSIDVEKKSLKFNDLISKNEYTHTVFIEVGTSQSCYNCHDWSKSIYEIYNSGDYDFQFVEMIVFDPDGGILNYKAYDWDSKYDISGFPTSIMDGDFKRIIGNHPEELPDKLNSCGSRIVKDIVSNMTVEWLGDATIIVNISIQNNELSQYNGYIRAPITEIVSRYDTYAGVPYHFGFLDYAFDKEISISPGGIYTDTIIWNGNEHEDNHGDNFGNIIPNNIQVIMGVFNDYNNFVDDTVMARLINNSPPRKPSNPSPINGEENVDIYTDLSWYCSDPDNDNLIYDIYLDTLNPPEEKVSTGQTQTTYNPVILKTGTTYYWKIVAFDDKGYFTSGPIWSFTTEGVDDKKPIVKIIKPFKGTYIFDAKVFPRIFRLTKIIGPITIEVDASDEESGVTNVEFYINGKLMENDTSTPYSYIWNRDHLRLFHLFIIKVIAYDKEGNSAVDWIIVRKFF